MIQAKKEQVQTPAALEWPENFYKEYNFEKRLDILEAQPETPDGEIGIRRQLVEKRYTYERQGSKEVQVDLFMRDWMMMRISAEQGVSFFNRKKLVREWKEYADEFGMTDFEAKSPKEQELLIREWQAFLDQLLYFCINDKTYGSMIFGALKMSRENLLGKIADELELITETFPAELGIGQLFKRFHKTAAEAYERI